MDAYIPLFQTLVWPIFLLLVGAVFRRQVVPIAEALKKRIEQGNSIKAGPIELGELTKLPYSAPSSTLADTTAEASASVSHALASWEEERTGIYKENQGIFLAHVLTPARRDPDGFDIYIFLVKHQRNDKPEPQDLSDVLRAEFFLGHMWGNRVFEEHPHQGMVGMSTSAYAPFLCVCHVHLADGTVLNLSRYIDFEMGKMVYKQSFTPVQSLG